jgi:hypothetical protein
MKSIITFALLLAAVSRAQSPVVTLTSATVTIDPASGDSYSLQGTFNGLSFTGAQAVLLSVGQFQTSLLLTDFVQQPGTNIYVYTDATGQAPYWVSSLTLNLEAQTFSAQASGIVLSGLTNPFALQLGTENGSACTMARLQSPDGANFQLTPGDGVNEPCQISFPQLSQPSFFAGQMTNIQFQVSIPTATNVDPGSVQLFQVDANAQPVSAPLCNLTASGTALDGGANYTCTVGFSNNAPGPVPLMIHATAGPISLLSPGFHVLAVAPMAQADIDAITNVTNAASTAWNSSYQTYQDTPQARIQTIAALQGLAGVQEVRLLEDGLSIGIEFTSGVRYTQILNRLNDSSPPNSQADSSVPKHYFQASIYQFAPRDSVQECNSPQRPVVNDNSVLIWNSGFFTEPNVSSIAQSTFKAVKCPVFFINQVPATIANAKLFPNYGTVVIDTHGAEWGADEYLLTSELAVPTTLPTNDPRWGTAQTGGIGLGRPSNASPLYWALAPAFFTTLGTFGKTLVFNGACYGARSTGLAHSMIANGGAYFGFTNEVSAPNAQGISIPGFATIAEPLLFAHLLNGYLSAQDSFNSPDVPKTDPSLQALLAKGLHLPVSSVNANFVLLPNNSPLAYLGNPQLVGPGASPYQVLSLATLDLHAQLDGASSCNGVMNYTWNNTAMNGHLMPADGEPGQDNFTITGTDGLYTPNSLFGLPTTSAADTITVDFLADPANPPAARACANVNVVNPPDQVLHIDFAGQGHSDYTAPKTLSGSYSASADLTWHYSWDMHIPHFQDLQRVVGNGLDWFLDPAQAGVSVTGTTTATNPITGMTCTGPPVVSGNTGAPFAGPAAVPSTVSTPYPIVHLYVETFGGGVYHLCDGNAIFGIGDQVPGYPGDDPGPGIYRFDLDLSQFVGKTTSMTMPASGSFLPAPDNTDTGMVTYGGTLTISTTAPAPTPSSNSKY